MSVNVFLPPSPVVPMFLNITGIANTNPMVVTTDTPNAWVPGQLGRFSIPFDYGMFQLNGLTGQVIAVDTTNLMITFDIYAGQFDAFVTPPFGAEQPATVAPAGARNIYNITSVPFHSLNGQVGN